MRFPDTENYKDPRTVNLNEGEERLGVDACPFCGCQEMVDFITINKEHQLQVYQIRCTRCLAAGPMASTEEKSAGLWNKRAYSSKDVRAAIVINSIANAATPTEPSGMKPTTLKVYELENFAGKIGAFSNELYNKEDVVVWLPKILSPFLKVIIAQRRRDRQQDAVMPGEIK